MIGPAQLARLARINRVLIKHGLDELAFSAPWLRPFRLVYYLSPWNWLRRNDRPRGERLRMAMEELGPVFVKFGQVLSTRRDVLPPDIADELARLQDDVPPFPGADARALVEAAQGRPIEAVFSAFEDRELASASLAQVHAATLRDGREVVVKVLRPGVESIIERDIGLMYRMARLVERYWPQGERLHPVEVVSEYEEVIRAELDLMREGANATMMRRNFEPGSVLYVPYVVWELTTSNVMVMERIGGIPIRDLGALRARGVSFRQLAERGVEIFFTQVFRHNFFHADMHPGNLFVDANDPQRPRYIAVDFGIVGTLTDRDQHYLAHNMLAFFNRDYRRVAELHVESGWVPEDTRVEQFEAAIRTVCEPIINRPLKEISFGQFLLRLFQTARRFNVEVQPQLILLQKTLLNVEGLGRELYPDLDLWATAKPTLERWMREQVGLPAVIQRLRTNLPEMMETLPDLPVRLSRAVDRLEASDDRQRRLEERLIGLEQSRRNGSRRGYAAIAGAGLLVAAAVLLGTGGTLPPAGPQDWLAVVMGSAALVVLAVGARR